MNSRPANSIETVIWVAVGGRGSLVGAALGAVVVNWAKTMFTSGFMAPYWLFALGALFRLRHPVHAERHFGHRAQDWWEKSAASPKP